MVVVLAGLSGGCRYASNFRFVPQPAMVEVPTATGEGTSVTAMTSVVGIRNRDKRARLPRCVEMRVRIDNHAAAMVVVDPHSMRLTNGLLMHFERPIVEPLTGLTLTQGQSASVTVYFPFPRGQNQNNTDLSSLHLQSELAVNAQPTTLMFTFTRMRPVYYHDPFWHPGHMHTGVFVRVR